MKKKKVIALLSCFALLCSILTACSQNQTTSSSSSSATQQSSTEAKTIGFMELANENTEHIWFRSDKISKDAGISGVYVTKNGKITYYNLRTYENSKNSYLSLLSRDTLTFSDIKDMSDSDIIKKAKTMDKESYESLYQGYVDTADYAITEWATDEEYQSDIPKVQAFKDSLKDYQTDASYNEYRKAVTDVQLSANVKTDDSGNTVRYETILSLPRFDEKEIDNDYSLKDSTSSNPFDLSFDYRDFGSGMVYNDNYTSLKHLITKDIPKNSYLGLDTTKTKNVTEK